VSRSRIDSALSLTGAVLPLVTKGSDVGDGIGLVPSSALGEPAEPVRGPRRPLAEDEAVLRDPDIEAVARADPEPSPRLAGHHDLMLGTDLDA
jgi:hypothetical protein